MIDVGCRKGGDFTRNREEVRKGRRVMCGHGATTLQYLVAKLPFAYPPRSLPLPSTKIHRRT